MGEAHVQKKNVDQLGFEPKTFWLLSIIWHKNNGSDNIKMMKVYEKIVCPSKL